MPGDRILAIDGVSTAGLSEYDPALLARGDVESDVELTIASAGGEESLLVGRAWEKDFAYLPAESPPGASPIDTATLPIDTASSG